MAKNTTRLNLYVKEIEYRIGYVVLSFLCVCVLAYQKALQMNYIFLLSFTTNEFTPKSFIFTDVYEAFSSTVSICLVASLLLIIPLTVYQILCFLVPSWHTYERRQRGVIVLMLFFFWCFYIYNVHFLITPYLCKFFLEFQVHTKCLTITIEARILSYVFWATRLLLIAHIIFLVASIAVLCITYKTVNAKEWGEYRKVLVWLALFSAAFISPPDPWSQFLLWFVFVFFSECALWIHFIYGKSWQIKLKH